jgi:hypothetical protein
MAKKENNWIPWVIIGGLVLYVMNQKPKEGGDSSTAAAVSAARKTIPNIRAAYREAFLDAAKGIEDGSIKDQEQWTEFIKQNAGARQRDALDKVYEAIDKLKLPVTFAGKEKELAEINRQIAGAW